MNAPRERSPIIIPWYIILHVIPFVNIPVFAFIGFLFIISLLAGSNASANAGSESVTKFTHNMCIGRSGSIRLIGILNCEAKKGVINIATNNTITSPTLLDNRN